MGNRDLMQALAEFSEPLVRITDKLVSVVDRGKFEKGEPLAKRRGLSVIDRVEVVCSFSDLEKSIEPLRVVFR